MCCMARRGSARPVHSRLERLYGRNGVMGKTIPRWALVNRPGPFARHLNISRYCMLAQCQRTNRSCLSSKGHTLPLHSRYHRHSIVERSTVCRLCTVISECMVSPDIRALASLSLYLLTLRCCQVCMNRRLDDTEHMGRVVSVEQCLHILRSNTTRQVLLTCALGPQRSREHLCEPLF